MSHVLAEDAKLYYNTGTYGSPTWTLIDNCQSLTLNLSKDAVDVTTRASQGFKEYVDGLIDASIEWGMLWDTEDTAFTAIRTAFFNKTAIEFLILDQEYDNTAAQGLRAICMVENFTRAENLGEALTVSVTVRPVANSNAAPSWY